MNPTKIEWCQGVINPIVGCSKCSPGCDNCYAEKWAFRHSKNPLTAKKYAGVVDEHGKWTGKFSGLDLSCFNKLPKKTPKKIFVGSMTDLFNHDLDWEIVERLFWEFPKWPHHTFILLTKRPDKALWFFNDGLELGKFHPNVWLGVTVCNQQEADEKIPVLLQTSAAKHFVSVEPMLGEVALEDWHLKKHCRVCQSTEQFYSKVEGHFLCNGDCDYESYPEKTHLINGLDWVICGGETGPQARPMHPDWVNSLQYQCEEAGVPFFFKSWGEWVPKGSPLDGDLWLNNNGATYPWTFESQVPVQTSVDSVLMRRVGKKTAGRLLDGREWNQYPEGHHA